ncbi:shikimate dehydrogenase [Marinobacterium sp. D7]|uniref:shikimate dehydrogenase family protein n=1 Tax=Marinobacterium ramblicola TaxID=2849041 RepID=UPI001C2DB849|nr:shikimate dehydrogenase [Marinobacterium ramblicola]MBV1788634.1 shikimate dehydrogenase [Marinobacterium ramblicola]
MIKLGLIGRSIAKSSSPSLHTLLGELTDYAIDYQLHEPRDDSPAAFADTLSRLRAEGYRGCNVTYPFKQVALDLANRTRPDASLVGSTNTLLLTDGVLAANTDYTGFIRGYRARLGDQAAGKVLLIGAGGVGRAVAFGLFEVGTSEVIVFDLNEAAAQSLADAINSAGYSARVAGTDALADAAREADGLANCTPVGHYKSPGNPLQPELFGGQKWAFDAVYTPLDTEFLIEAHRHGLALMSGFDLFIYQGIDAFEIFMDTKVDAAKALTAFQQKYALLSELIR